MTLFPHPEATRIAPRSCIKTEIIGRRNKWSMDFSLSCVSVGQSQIGGGIPPKLRHRSTRGKKYNRNYIQFSDKNSKFIPFSCFCCCFTQTPFFRYFFPHFAPPPLFTGIFFQGANCHLAGAKFQTWRIFVLI